MKFNIIATVTRRGPRAGLIFLRKNLGKAPDLEKPDNEVGLSPQQCLSTDFLHFAVQRSLNFLKDFVRVATVPEESKVS